MLIAQDTEGRLVEIQQRLNWFIDGIGIHGLTWELFRKIPTTRLTELYNVDKGYFEYLSSNNFIKQLHYRLRDNQKVEKTCDIVLGGYKITYTCGDLKFVYRTTGYWGEDYIMYGDSHKVTLKSEESLKLRDYFLDIKEIVRGEMF